MLKKPIPCSQYNLFLTSQKFWTNHFQASKISHEQIWIFITNQLLRGAAPVPTRPTAEWQILACGGFSWGKETPGKRRDLPEAGSSCGRCWQGLGATRATAATPHTYKKQPYGVWVNRSTVNRAGRVWHVSHDVMWQTERGTLARAWCSSLHSSLRRRARKKGVVTLPAQELGSIVGHHPLRRNLAMVRKLCPLHSPVWMCQARQSSHKNKLPFLFSNWIFLLGHSLTQSLFKLFNIVRNVFHLVQCYWYIAMFKIYSICLLH